MENIYEILLCYSDDDDTGVISYMLDTYEKAVAKFKEIIEEEKKSINWIKNAFESEENLKNYDFNTNIDNYPTNEEHRLFWDITDKNDWYQHDYLELRIKEIL